MKDSMTNIVETGEFVLNAVSRLMIDAMNTTSGDYPRDVDEFELAGLPKVASKSVQPSRIDGALWHLECTLDQIIPLKSTNENQNTLAIASIVQVHIDDSVIEDGIVNQSTLEAVARCGYRSYAQVQTFFELSRPVSK